jgi:hypothetical protein
MKNKTDADVVNQAMKFWVPFAASRVIKKTPGGFKIRRELLAPSKKRPNKGKGKKSRYSNTVAAAIIFDRLKDQGLKPTADFIHRVERFVGARQNSAQFLRAGFIPAYRQFGLKNRNPGTQKHFKGRSEGKKAKSSAFFKVEAFAKNAREGAHIIAPNAFRESLIEVEQQFMKFMIADLNKVARTVGLNP